MPKYVKYLICSKIHHLSGNFMGANAPVRAASMITVRVLVDVLPQVSVAT